MLLAGLVAVVVILTYAPNTAYALDQSQCLSCHKDPLLTKPVTGGGEVSLYVDEAALNSSAHQFTDCVTCHGTDPHQGGLLTKQTLAEKCGQCHEYQYEQHLQSVHGVQLTQGNPDVATCTDCHSHERNPHSIDRALEYEAPTYKKNIAQTCAKCHGNEELMDDYGIVEKVYESYMRSFHGKAMQLGSNDIDQLNKATCINCHGTHNINVVDDPNSPVAGIDNLTETCEKCHPGAGTEFAKSFLGHKDASPDNIPVAYYVEKIFSTLMKVVLGFGLLLVISACVRFAIHSWKE